MSKIIIKNQTEMEEIEIFKWIYDNPKDKENELLGKFKMTKVWLELMSDYSFTTYGIKDGLLWRIRGLERKGNNGGTIIFIEKLIDSEDVKVYLNFHEIAKEVSF